MIPANGERGGYVGSSESSQSVGYGTNLQSLDPFADIAQEIGFSGCEIEDDEPA